MIVRVRLRYGPKIRRGQGKNRHVALALASLLWPATLMAYVLGFWRLGADLRVMGDFAIASGLFSHWQVWLGTAVALNLTAALLNRYGHGGQLRLPVSFLAWISNFGNRRV